MLAIPEQHLAMQYKFSVALPFTASIRFGFPEPQNCSCDRPLPGNLATFHKAVAGVNFARFRAADGLRRTNITARVLLVLIGSGCRE